MLNKKNRKYKTIIIWIVLVALIAVAAVLFAKEGANHDSYLYKIIRPSLPDNALEIIFSKNQYVLGEEIFFGVLNKTNQTLRIENECPKEPLDIYRLEKDVWIRIKGQTKNPCRSTEDIIIRPYELRGASYLPWQGAIFSVPGKYKIELRVEGYGNKFAKEFEIMTGSI